MATFTNRATLSYNGITTNSNIVTGTLGESITVTKTAVYDQYTDGGTVTYAINLTNTGNSATTLSLIDDLGAYTFGATTLYPLEYVDGAILYYVNGILQPTPTVTAGPPLTVSNITVPANSNATVIYTADTTEYAPLEVDGFITNTVTAATATASETVYVANQADVRIIKALSPTSVVENDTLTYTFTIQNFGNTELAATDNAVITDLLNPVLDPITVTLNGVALTQGVDYTYNTTTGQFETVAGIITVPAATFTQSPTGEWTVEPSVSTLVISGTV